MKQEIIGLQTNTNESVKQAKQGHFKLEKIRSVIPDEYLEKTKDFDRIQVCMLNDYLNKYTEKLSRGNAFDPKEIKLD